MAAFMVEPVTRHIQLLAFMLPKMIETIANSLEHKRKFKQKDWHSRILLLLAMAIFAFFAI